MKTLFSTLLVMALFLYSAIEVCASPAFPGLGKVKQPDGSTISLYLKGDEKVHWMESEDGYSLLYDSRRNIVYATADNDGNMIPSSVTARDIAERSPSDQAFLRNISKKLYYSPAQVNTFKTIWQVVQKSSNANSGLFRAAGGTIHAICALVNFSDKQLVKTPADFDALLNQVGYSVGGDKGSVHDFYVENSYGQVDLEITVAGPYTLSKPWSYYGQNDINGNDSLALVHEFAKEAADLTFNDPAINPAEYDNDGDGYIDAFHIIHAGYGEEVVGADPNNIWAHESGFYPALKYGNKSLDIYSCSSELQGISGANITNIGVICHEMGHVFGALDFYDTDGDASGGNFLGTGNWDLMASGSWNNSGACPAHINMYQKIQFGWVKPVVLTQGQAISDMPNSAKNAVAYRYDTSTPGEYFILENRQQTGFDQFVPGHGLLIYHVNINKLDSLNNTINVRHPQEVYPVCASATTNPTGTVDSYGNINSSGCPFPGTSNKTSFTDYTIPSATSWKGANTLKPLTEIQEQNSAVSFKFLMQSADPVINLKATIVSSSVTLTWFKPANSDVIGYNIYRDNQKIISLTGDNTISYTQYNVPSGTYSYCVTARYADKESAPVCQSATVNNSTVNGNSLVVQNLTAQSVNGNKDIQLNWNSPFVSDWVSHAQNNDYILTSDTIKFTTASRFTVDDLQNFYGSKLTKVRFWVNTTTSCTYTIQIWQTNSGDTIGNAIYIPTTPIATKTVTNPTKGIMDVTLDTPIPVVNNKELWIGIQYQMPQLINVAILDGDSPSATLRNWIYKDTQGWKYISITNNINWYIAGYLQFDNTFLSPPAGAWMRSANATATNYVVYRDNNVKLTTTTQTQYVDPQPPTGTHIYRVSILYDDGSESEQVCVEASSGNTSLEAVNNPDAEISLFPNPVKRGENLTIQCDAGVKSTLLIYSISGQLVQQEQITGPVVHKRMDFDPGVYLLKINSNAKSFVRRLIIK